MYCIKCGTKTETVSDQPYLPLSNQVTPPYETNWSQPYREPSTNRRKKNPTPILIAIGVVCAIALGAGIYVFLDPFNNKNDNDLPGEPDSIQDGRSPDDTSADTADPTQDQPDAPLPGKPDVPPQDDGKGNDDGIGDDDNTDNSDDTDDKHTGNDPPDPSNDHWDRDYIFDFSSSRLITDDELNALSLAELRIARNEIYARHGRLFSCPMLDKWFFSKDWYVSLPNKISPAAFDRGSSPLSRTESSNSSRISAREDHLVQNGQIFPTGDTKKLTEYDLILRRTHLQRGLNEMYTRAGVSSGNKDALNDVERYNVDLIENALSLAEIRY